VRNGSSRNAVQRLLVVLNFNPQILFNSLFSLFSLGLQAG
jgi:hypothetical protein